MTRFPAVAYVAAIFIGAVLAEEPKKTEWLPGTYAAWSQGKRHALIVREDGVTEFRHLGKGDWARGTGRSTAFRRFP